MRIKIKAKTNRPGREEKAIVVGIVGKIGSGKDVVAGYITRKYNGKSVSLSDYISQMLNIFHLPASRQNIILLITKIRKRFGKGILARAVISQVDNNGFPIYLINGVRLKREEEILRQRFGKHFILLAISCDDRIRFVRIKKRERKEKLNKDATNISLERFIGRENEYATEKEISLLMRRKADYIIANNGSFELLREKIDKLLKEKLKIKK